MATLNLTHLAVNNHWTGLLEWITGLTYNELPLPVKLHPVFDQSVTVSSHCTEPNIFKQQMKIVLLFVATIEGSLCPTQVKVLAWIAPYPSLFKVEKVMSTRL